MRINAAIRTTDPNPVAIDELKPAALIPIGMLQTIVPAPMPIGSVVSTVAAGLGMSTALILVVAKILGREAVAEVFAVSADRLL